MIEKLHLEEFELYNTDQKTRNLSLKINEIIDLLKELKEINKKYDELFDACCESINVHERQIDKLQMALESNLPDGDDAIQEVIHEQKEEKMTTIDCPFCNTNLEYDENDLMCPNPYCEKTDGCWGTDEMWDLLIDTKKKLDIAVDALKEIIDWDNCVALQLNDFVGIASKALEQITALEQKDNGGNK